jgi:DNA-binding response OmpR family regulator
VHILIVEDHPDVAANLGDFLQGHGHAVDFAADGASALRLAQRGHFDVIVLDRMLPRLDGASVCRTLRERGCAAPVLMLTAMDAVGERVAGLEAGADDYLVKPFAMAELKARIEALHRRADGAVGRQVLRVADLEYDTGTLRATRDGEAVELNPMTRKLLECLMRQAPRVVPHAELSRLLWGDDPPSPETLRAHLHALRVAVDRPHARKLVHTVHGTGYRIADE